MNEHKSTMLFGIIGLGIIILFGFGFYEFHGFMDPKLFWVIIGGTFIISAITGMEFSRWRKDLIRSA